jgi:glutathione S-transferase
MQSICGRIFVNGFKIERGAAPMKIYNSKLAPNPRRVRIYLAEKGLSVPLVEVDLARLDHKSTEYTAVNPFQVVPTLELDDGAMIS